MSRIRLKVQGVTDISANLDSSLLILTDEAEKRQLTVICDAAMRFQFAIRRGRHVGSKEARQHAAEFLQYALPEAVASLIKYLTNLELCVVIVNIFDGQYRAVLEDQRTGTAIPIRVSDGALLSYADQHIPLYCEESIWQMQSMPYAGENAPGISMPLNTLTIPMLQKALDDCIEQENYEMAQKIKEEMERRIKD